MNPTGMKRRLFLTGSGILEMERQQVAKVHSTYIERRENIRSGLLPATIHIKTLKSKQPLSKYPARILCMFPPMVLIQLVTVPGSPPTKQFNSQLNGQATATL